MLRELRDRSCVVICRYSENTANKLVQICLLKQHGRVKYLSGARDTYMAENTLPTRNVYKTLEE